MEIYGHNNVLTNIDQASAMEKAVGGEWVYLHYRRWFSISLLCGFLSADLQKKEKFKFHSFVVRYVDWITM